MSDNALELRDLTKVYTLGQELTLQQSVSRLGGRQTAQNTLEALHDVSFDVPRGSTFGVVGSNGSGKSTLTQIVSGIAIPTAGEVRVWGTVLPLLEVGAGFHPELTGRENVTLLGVVYGLTRKQIRSELTRIAAFADVERHLDTPLKRYSSGMQARLSFATALCFPADIYVFDEVLSVVDDDFRQRCREELVSLSQAGRTVIFMSHDLDLVRDTCSIGVWLEKGRLRASGTMEEVAHSYAGAPPVRTDPPADEAAVAGGVSAER